MTARVSQPSLRKQKVEVRVEPEVEDSLFVVLLIGSDLYLRLP